MDRERHRKAIGEQDNGAAIVRRRVVIVVQLLVKDRIHGKQAQGEHQYGAASRKQAAEGTDRSGLVKKAQAAPTIVINEGPSREGLGSRKHSSALLWVSDRSPLF